MSICSCYYVPTMSLLYVVHTRDIKHQNKAPFFCLCDFPVISLCRKCEPGFKKTVPKWHDVRIARIRTETFSILNYAYVHCAYEFLRKFFFYRRSFKNSFSCELLLCLLESFVPFRVHRFLPSLWVEYRSVYRSRTFSGDHDGTKFALRCRFVFRVFELCGYGI